MRLRAIDLVPVEIAGVLIGSRAQSRRERRRRCGRALGLAAVLAVGGPAIAAKAEEAPPPCREASVPVLVHGQRALIDVALDGRAARMVLDTGASGLVLLADAPARLGLPLDASHAPERLLSYGRPFEVKFARVERVRFAGETRAVADLPVASGGWSEAGVDGFFNDPRLQQAEFDLAAGRVRLACPGAQPPAWTRGAHVSVLRLEPRRRLFVTTLVNGVPLRVMFDSGSPGWSMTLEAARRAGVRVDGAPDAGAAGLGAGAVLRAWTVRLDRLELGDEAARHAPMLVVDKPNASADMLAGFEVFATHRIWIDRAGGRLFMQPNEVSPAAADAGARP